MDRSRALIQYWRSCLADVDLRSPEVKDAKTFQPTLEEIVAGRFSEKLTREIFTTATAERQRRGKQNGEEAEMTSVSLLIAPFGLRRRFRHGAAPEGESRRYNPVWLPAALRRDGTLQKGEEGSPWISRELLEPVTQDQPAVGRLDDFDRFLTEAPQPTSPQWNEIFAYAQAMVKAVLGTAIETVEIDGCEVLSPLAILWNDDRRIGQAILTLYDKTLKRDEIPPLLRTLADGASPAPAPPPYDLTGSSPALRHLGQMGRFFLSPSQRQTVHGLLTLPKGGVLAVNGPPGTGKTTVLQSIVASLWVEAALVENAAPPIILACSTNNQAVTNILESFAEAAFPHPDDLWTERWLPDLTSYGLFLPSFSKLNDAEYKKFQRAVPGRPAWLGLPEVMENTDYVRRAEAEYLDRARKAFDGADLRDLETVIPRLRKLLAETRRRLAEVIEDAREIEALRRVHACSTHLEALAFIQKELTDAARVRADLDGLHAEVLAALQSVPFFEDLLSFLPPIRERRNRRLALPFLKRHRQPPATTGMDLAKALPEILRNLLEEARARLAAMESWQSREGRLASRLAELGARPLDEPGRALDALDLLRHRLFLIAGRYWEARWLLEMKTLLSDGRSLHAQKRDACEARFRRFAMLTPCMVATFYQAPKAFDYYDRETGSSPLFETIDLLIVDEAGQVSPEVGAATFALAKRALVIGDIHQIEPVWGIPPFVDAANLREAGIEPPKDEEKEESWAFRASRGNLMSLARCATALTCEHDRGLFLSEHRRSVPEVIRFCNELVYRDRLQPLRPSKPDNPLPALGWAHITSPAVRDGGSRTNPGEARVIADWLARHKQQLENHYQRPLEDIAAVITPFVAQRASLEKAFRDAKLKVRAGTVHTFQGAERQIILFSPVYSFTDAPRSLFFDMGPNLLNVAVSRAKDSFLIFGDMRIFDPSKDTLPSGKLARLAFRSENSEIADIESAQHLQTIGELSRISTLEEHRKVLREALEKSTERVLIVSPYLTKGAVVADDVPALLKAAKERGVRICVVYSRDLNQWPDSAARVADMLSKAGAEIKVATRMHSKTLAVDGSRLIEGSFNWLSAKREAGHPRQYQESSLDYRGDQASRLIVNAWHNATGEKISFGMPA